jgi:hypothetical protein
MRDLVRWAAPAVLAALVLSSCVGSDAERAESYLPEVDPSRFSATVDNAFFPLVPGTTFHYRTPDGSERVEVTVTDRKREVMGVECTVVESREYEDDRLAEITLDWYAEDVQGSVWYFGEDTRAFAEDGSEARAGSWEAAVDGAHPGVVIPGAPVLGQPYRQEYYAGRAEDVGQVERLDGVVEVPYGSFEVRWSRGTGLRWSRGPWSTSTTSAEWGSCSRTKATRASSSWT